MLARNLLENMRGIFMDRKKEVIPEILGLVMRAQSSEWFLTPGNGLENEAIAKEEN